MPTIEERITQLETELARLKAELSKKQDTLTRFKPEEDQKYYYVLYANGQNIKSARYFMDWNKGFKITLCVCQNPVMCISVFIQIEMKELVFCFFNPNGHRERNH